MTVSPSDLFLSPDLTERDAQHYLQVLGFRDPAGADLNLKTMADEPQVRETLGALADLLLDTLRRTPDPDAALVGLSRHLAARTAKVTFLQYLRDDPKALQVLVEILGTSPFLSEILIRRPEYFHWLMSIIDRTAPDLFDDDEIDPSPAAGVIGLNALKRLKRQHMLGIAARDILGRDTLQVASAHLSALADLVVGRALDIVARERLSAEGRERLPGRFAVIGLGKLGGEELNYSSDIDLIYVYEPEREDDPEPHDFFHRLARKLTAALTDHSEETYLYRVDLRLRPMGRGGNIAHSLQQLRQYYETWGVTFERFAMIKARPIAGDVALGSRFVEAVEPFVYRKYLDHAALEEMYQHKTLVDRTISHSERNRNVKLGRGGIREVELFTQVLQLTYGVRHPELKQRNTLAGLDALRRIGLISEADGDAVVRAYIFLRTVEHRLQIVQESQTHTLSNSRQDLAICARRLRFESVEALEAELEAQRQRVHEVYRGLFERRPGTGDFHARQFFRILANELPEAEALAHLTDSGFRDAAAALAAIHAFVPHVSLASAPTAARNVLANVLAACTEQLARCARPERVLMRLEQLAVHTGGAVMLGRSLLEDTTLREVLIDVLDHGELPAQRLIRDPELLDSLVLPIPTTDALRRSLDAKLAAMERFDRAERMNELRRFKRREEFKILVGWLATASLDRLLEELTLLADYCTVRSARWHAPAPLDDPAASWAIVALGKLGGMELTVHSDLDLVIVYEDQRDPMDSKLRWQEFVELLQRFLAEPTSEGVAYRIDTRLRPEGTKGPLAIPLPALVRYFDERAQPWERLAWTRACILGGSPKLAERISSAAGAFVYGPWDARMPGYMHGIRTRMEREIAKEGSSKIDFKVGRGGLADIDFLIELVQIREGRTRPEFRVTGTRHLLAALPSTPYITPGERDQLRDAYGIMRTLETLARLDSDANISWIVPDPSVLTALGKWMGLADPPGERLLFLYRETTERIRSIYTAVLRRLDDRLSN